MLGSQEERNTRSYVSDWAHVLVGRQRTVPLISGARYQVRNDAGVARSLIEEVPTALDTINLLATLVNYPER